MSSSPYRPQGSDPHRRDFLKRLATAGAGVALAGMAAPMLVGAPGWGGAQAATVTERSFDFSVPAAGRRMGVGRDPERDVALDMALSALGGLKSFVTTGDRVVLKVNAGFSTPPELGATTHPALLEALIRRCRQAGAVEVVVTDNPVADTLSCFQVTGIAAAAKKAGARLVLPTADSFTPLTLPGGQLIRDWPVLLQPLLQATKYISVCPLKHHYLAGATMTIKNAYGLLGGSRGVFHQDVNAVIAELSQLVKPTLSVLDATWAMVRNGPTGGSTADLEERGFVAVSSDPVAVDAFGASLLGLAPADLTYLLRAATVGAGSADWRSFAAGSLP